MKTDITNEYDNRKVAKDRENGTDILEFYLKENVFVNKKLTYNWSHIHELAKF